MMYMYNVKREVDDCLIGFCVVVLFKDKKEIMEEHQRQLADREVRTHNNKNFSVLLILHVTLPLEKKMSKEKALESSYSHHAFVCSHHYIFMKIIVKKQTLV